MKKTLIMTLAFFMLLSVPVAASNEIANEELRGYERFEGEVVEINKDEKVNEILVQMEDSKMYLFINEEKVMDLKTGEFVKDHDFSKGEKVLFYLKKDSPMFLSEPPKVNPDIVVINPTAREFSIDVDFFEKDGSGVSNRLKINGLEETKVLTIEGKEFDKNKTLGNDLLVLYTASTRSIPPQTIPEKVVVLSENLDEGIKLPDSPKVIEDKEAYALRAYYEKLDAKVDWDSETMGITISKDDKKVEINTKDSILKIEDKESEIEYFVIENGVSYSTLKLYEDINKYLFD